MAQRTFRKSAKKAAKKNSKRHVKRSASNSAKKAAPKKAVRKGFPKTAMKLGLRRRGRYAVFCDIDGKLKGGLTSSTADAMKADHERSNMGHTCTVMISNRRR